MSEGRYVKSKSICRTNKFFKDYTSSTAVVKSKETAKWAVRQKMFKPIVWSFFHIVYGRHLCQWHKYTQISELPQKDGWHEVHAFWSILASIFSLPSTTTRVGTVDMAQWSIEYAILWWLVNGEFLWILQEYTLCLIYHACGRLAYVAPSCYYRVYKL